MQRLGTKTSLSRCRVAAVRSPINISQHIPLRRVCVSAGQQDVSFQRPLPMTIIVLHPFLDGLSADEVDSVNHLTQNPYSRLSYKVETYVTCYTMQSRLAR